MSDDSHLTPQGALQTFERKLSQLADEYARGLLNASQYNAIYRYYSEKRALVEHIIATNPDNPTWRTVAMQDDTSFLRVQFESKMLYCAVFRRGSDAPLLTEGKIPRSVAEQLFKTLQAMWDSEHWRVGMARKSLGEGVWMVVCLGEQAMTVTVFYLPPSNQQYNAIKETHQDFEEANGRLLSRNVASDRLVFPQRSLFEGRL